MVSLNNDMISEVKVQSSQLRGRVRRRRHERQRRHEGGHFVVPRRGLLLPPRFEVRGQRPVELDRGRRRSRRRTTSTPASTSAVRSSSATATRRTRTSCSSSSPTSGSGSRSTRAAASRARTPPAMKTGDFSELLANRGSNLNSVPQLRIPAGLPGAGSPAPNNNMAPYMTPLGSYLASLYPDPNYNDPNNLFNYVYHCARAAGPRRDEDAVRLEHHQQHQGVRPHLPRSGRRTVQPARHVVGAVVTWRCRRPTSTRSSAGPTAPTSSRC